MCADVQARADRGDHNIPGVDSAGLPWCICHQQRRACSPQFPSVIFAHAPFVPQLLCISTYRHISSVRQDAPAYPASSPRHRGIPRLHMVHALVHPVRAVCGAQNLWHVILSAAAIPLVVSKTLTFLRYGCPAFPDVPLPTATTGTHVVLTPSPRIIYFSSLLSSLPGSVAPDRSMNVWSMIYCVQG